MMTCFRAGSRGLRVAMMVGLASSAVLLGCSDDAPSGDPSPPSGDAAPFSLPRLEPGTHVSMIRGFNPPDADLDPLLDAFWQDARDAGMRSGRIQIDWADLETAPGVYDEARLVEALERADLRDLQILAGVYALDTEGPVLPDDLQAAVLGGTRLDDPEVAERWEDFLRWLLPVLDRYDVWGLLITNEPDSWIVDEGDRPAEEVAAFYAQANRIADAVTPEIVVGATHTSFVRTNPERFHTDTLREIDFASYNYYPLDPLLFSVGSDADAVRDALDRYLEVSDGKPVVIQELGASAGWPDRPSDMGATVEQQLTFYRTSLDVAQRNDQLRAVYAFQLVDWSAETYGIFRDILAAEGTPPDFLDRNDEYLGTLGLIDITGTPRPAWPVFLDAVRATASP
ncbi:MAG: hypothetical protein AAF928_01390 [Myxococcota bacterium]